MNELVDEITRSTQSVIEMLNTAKELVEPEKESTAIPAMLHALTIAVMNLTSAVMLVGLNF